MTDDAAPVPAAPVPAPPAPGGRRALVRLALLAVLLAAGGALVLTGHLPSVATVRGWAAGAGAWAPAAFAVAYGAATLFPAPKFALSTAAGLVFGLATGWVVVWSGAMLGAAAAFVIGRRLGRDGVQRLAGRHLARLDDLVERHGAGAVLVARLVPFVPFTGVNYGSGVTRIRFAPFLAATAAGILPGTFSYVAVGAYGTQPGRWPFLLGVGVLAVLGLGGLVGAHRSRGRGSRDEAA